MTMVLITRPLNQSFNLQNKLKTINVESIIFPTMIIEPLINSNSLLIGIKSLPKSQIVIFTSVNAVQFTLQHWPNATLLKNLQVVAIGPATAKSLIDYNIQVAYTAPPPYTSEALLTLPIFNHVANKRIIIFKGENGRSLLKETLQQLHAEVIEALCYQRVAEKLLPDIVKKNWSSIEIIVTTSAESLKNLIHLFVHNPASLLQKTLLVPSQRILTLAKELGFEKILLAENPTDDAVFNAINRYFVNK